MNMTPMIGNSGSDTHYAILGLIESGRSTIKTNRENDVGQCKSSRHTSARKTQGHSILC